MGGGYSGGRLSPHLPPDRLGAVAGADGTRPQPGRRERIMQTIQTEIGITTRYTIHCEQGHCRVIRVSGDHARWEWADGTHGTLVPKESYAYTHGGCCYRAACARVGALSA